MWSLGCCSGRRTGTIELRRGISRFYREVVTLYVERRAMGTKRLAKVFPILSQFNAIYRQQFCRISAYQWFAVGRAQPMD